MKIDGSIKNIGSGSIGGGGTKLGKGTSGAADSGGSDQVQLSSLSTQLRSLQGSMSDSPVVDTARVAEIKQAIVEGRFKVNPEAVADHLLETARQLLRASAN